MPQSKHYLFGQSITAQTGAQGGDYNIYEV